MAQKFNAAPASEKLAYTIQQAAELSSLCRSSIYRQMELGALSSVKIGKRRLIPAQALRDWLARAQAA
jgi:excisionase family DNA binding protein